MVDVNGTVVGLITLEDVVAELLEGSPTNSVGTGCPIRLSTVGSAFRDRSGSLRQQRWLDPSGTVSIVRWRSDHRRARPNADPGEELITASRGSRSRRNRCGLGDSRDRPGRNRRTHVIAV